MLKTPVISRRRSVGGSFGTCGECFGKRWRARHRWRMPVHSATSVPDAAVDRGTLLSRSPPGPQADRGGSGRPSLCESMLRVIEGATCQPSEQPASTSGMPMRKDSIRATRAKATSRTSRPSGNNFSARTQFTDSRGAVSFETIYPGWYTGRATHIHFKVLLDSRNVLTGQMYFPDAVKRIHLRETFRPMRSA